MLAVDTNVLVYSFVADSPFHERAASALETLAESAAPWAIPWSCIHEFFAVATNPKIFSAPGLPAAARDQVDAWLESPSLQLLAETSSHWRTLDALLEANKIAGPAVHDARIAAVCLSHGVTEILTLDRDFSRFAEMKTRSI